MSWVIFDDEFLDHPKTIKAGRDARDLFIASVFYCNKNLKDGFVMEEVLPALAFKAGVPSAKKHAATLVSVGFWEPVEGGWYIHDYHKYQKTKAEILALREVRSHAGREGGRKSAASKAEAKCQANASANAEQNSTQNLKPKPSASNEASTDRQTVVGGDVFDPSGGRSTREPAAVLIRRLTATHPEFIAEAERITAERGDAIDNPTSYKASLLRAMEADTYDWPAPPKPKHRRIIKLIPLVDEQGRDAPDFPVYEGQDIEETKAWLIETRGAHCLREIREAAA